MSANQKNYQVMENGTFTDFAEKGRAELGETLGLSGCEISINSIPAGKGSSFVHTHQLNEEVYIVINGSGTFYVDGEEFPVQEGSAVRVDPDGERAMKAGGDGMVYLCIQAQKDSLTQKTMNDGVIVDTKAAWM